MKTLNNAFLLLAAAVLTIGSASAQTVANPKPATQGRALPAPRPVFGNAQIGATTRAGAIDNESFVSQTGLSNWGVVNQSGTTNTADMVQVNNSSNVLGNDGYQNQVGTSNDAFMLQVGQGNYACQDQQGDMNVALSVQGTGAAARNQNYSVQEQSGDHNYGYVNQNSDRNFAHQDQTSSGTATSFGGGLAPSSAANGNWADTRQGNGTAASDGQWSQVVQNGQNNRSTVRQDNP